MMMKTAKGCFDCRQEFYSGPFNILCFSDKIRQEKRNGKKVVSCTAETKEELLQLLWAFSMPQWCVQKISYTFLSTADFLHN